MILGCSVQIKVLGHLSRLEVGQMTDVGFLLFVIDGRSWMDASQSDVVADSSYVAAAIVVVVDVADTLSLEADTAGVVAQLADSWGTVKVCGARCRWLIRGACGYHWRCHHTATDNVLILANFITIRLTAEIGTRCRPTIAAKHCQTGQELWTQHLTLSSLNLPIKCNFIAHLPQVYSCWD